ncbi:cysteine hydrolase family protein [Tunturiibacter gelidoferens]|uniref:Isochorismatase family cysteine hydrolase n=2 Tax=Tunturiibacter gelidiferens TaxID=3069689 RepID=A0AAU7Z7T1_9BACT|nr:isochorismatase family cysteine hydrolase [Edaphobacter lichenicola]MBB5339382.1 nicotinamidase-related amidase [Edaphobacter lichenicola]
MITDNGIEIFTALQDLVHPQRTALLVYDMQVGIIPQIKEGAEILSKVSSLLQATRRAGIRTIFTRHMSLPPELMGSFQYRMAMAWQGKQNPAEISSPFLRDSQAFQLAPELQPLPSEAIFDKLSMSAFEGTPLQFTLRDCGIRSLLLVGIALEIGIEPTCRQAADLGIIPILIRDACGAGNAEAANHCVASLQHMGDTIVTDLATISALVSAIPVPGTSDSR